MHAITSGLKVLCTMMGVQDLEVPRRSMGGHGYSAFAGLGRLYTEYLPSVTSVPYSQAPNPTFNCADFLRFRRYEGDNFVLDQQVVRAALKSFSTLFSSKFPSASVSSLSRSSQYLRLLLRPAAPLPESSWGWVALLVREHAQTADEPDAAVYQHVSKAVTEAFMAVQVGEINQTLTSLPVHDAHVIRSLYTLYLLTTVEAGLVDLLSFGLLLPRVSRSLSRSCPFIATGDQPALRRAPAECDWADGCIRLHRLGA
ncbi:Peroxisomal acyl-coenzyme A oxidase 1 [Hypsizygus marmoreus]|uniref:Peroxisomal acyl-coenzyme A oxidase 1 n=1 Tax=Hypsizygus marmoreus TaxID=39966 RepID=A0A369JHS5_HYPMA|nr:Peroxisomal acyl-coenzyme A oxidase 1 [Hypsizygus marmoreus]